MLQLKFFLDQRSNNAQECSLSNDEILQEVSEVLAKLADTTFSNVTLFISAQKQLEDTLFPFLREEFREFCLSMSKKYKTFAFWDRFLNDDMFAYIEFYIALRNRNWVGRLAA
ncbi:unnamed protein product, partial [marine sediment metagenome]